MHILGISAYYHDSAAVLIRDGHIVAAAQEERFTRRKNDARFPHLAAGYCLKTGGIDVDDLDFVAFYDKPLLKFERLIETYVAYAPLGFSSFRKAIPVWLKEKLFLKNLLCKELLTLGGNKSVADRLLFSEHHQSHAASAFFPSPFQEALVLTLDGVGEWVTSSLAIGRNTSLTLEKEIHFPHSIGLLYSAFTYYLGFKVNSGEYKVMGLAPYGSPVFRDRILDNLIDLKEDGSFRLNMSYFDYASGLRMTGAKFANLFGRKERKIDSGPLEQFHMDVAASIQSVTEEIILRLARSAAKEYGLKNLCLAGGVALNCVANGKIATEQIFDNIWVQPASGDAGGALGAALSAYFEHANGKNRPINPQGDQMSGALLGPSYDDNEIEASLKTLGAHYTKYSDTNQLIEITAAAIANGNAVGWFQGRMEFGPRALGARSILADPRDPEMQRALNLKIKFREGFRPFAPSVLADDVQDWFEFKQHSPYMLFTTPIHASCRKPLTAEELELSGFDKLKAMRSTVPAITHVDYSSRIQTVHEDTNPRYYALLKTFKSMTGCPILINTSFNVRGEPIVCSPADAFKCFMGSGLDKLIIGNFILNKEDQDPRLAEDYKSKFEKD